MAALLRILRGAHGRSLEAQQSAWVLRASCQRRRALPIWTEVRLDQGEVLELARTQTAIDGGSLSAANCPCRQVKDAQESANE